MYDVPYAIVKKAAEDLDGKERQLRPGNVITLSFAINDTPGFTYLEPAGVEVSEHETPDGSAGFASDIQLPLHPLTHEDREAISRLVALWRKHSQYAGKDQVADEELEKFMTQSGLYQRLKPLLQFIAEMDSDDK